MRAAQGDTCSVGGGYGVQNSLGHPAAVLLFTPIGLGLAVFPEGGREPFLGHEPV